MQDFFHQQYVYPDGCLEKNQFNGSESLFRSDDADEVPLAVGCFLPQPPCCDVGERSVNACAWKAIWYDRHIALSKMQKRGTITVDRRNSAAPYIEPVNSTTGTKYINSETSLSLSGMNYPTYGYIPKQLVEVLQRPVRQEPQEPKSGVRTSVLFSNKQRVQIQ